MQAGWEIFNRGGTALDAVEAAVMTLEDNELFNAGRGGMFTLNGEVETESSVMDGLQLLPDTAIDTHFVTRGRIVRMAQIIAANPGCLGIGLEEDTAVLVTAGREFEVLGNGIVVLVDGLGCTGNTLPQVQPGEVFSVRDLRVHLLSRGQRYTMPAPMANGK